MVVRLASLALVAGLLIGCGAAAPTRSPTSVPTVAPTATLPPATPTATPSPSGGPIDALTGTWDTGPNATDEFTGQNHAEFRVRFYEENGRPFVTIVGWDPTKGSMPSDGDHGPYKLLPGGQIGIASADQPQFFTIYNYELSGDVLTLTWVANDPDGPDASDTSGSFGTITLRRV